jgi:hypothetical protein
MIFKAFWIAVVAAGVTFAGSTQTRAESYGSINEDANAEHCAQAIQYLGPFITPEQNGQMKINVPDEEGMNIARDYERTCAAFHFRYIAPIIQQAWIQRHQQQQVQPQQDDGTDWAALGQALGSAMGRGNQAPMAPPNSAGLVMRQGTPQSRPAAPSPCGVNVSYLDCMKRQGDANALRQVGPGGVDAINRDLRSLGYGNDAMIRR